MSYNINLRQCTAEVSHILIALCQIKTNECTPVLSSNLPLNLLKAAVP